MIDKIEFTDVDGDIHIINQNRIEHVEVGLLHKKTSGAPKGDEHGIYREAWSLKPLEQLTLSFAWEMRLGPEVKGEF